MSIAKRGRWVPRTRLNAVESLEPRLLLTGAPIINEFVASTSNGAVLVDEDGDASDWFEVYNPTTEVIDLAGWYASDDVDRLQQWEFPGVALAPGEFLIVFASNKDRATAGRELHTNFKLAAGGESLFLVEPDGATISREFNPYPSQREDISYGISQSTDVLLPAGVDVKYRIPSSNDVRTYGARRFRGSHSRGTSRQSRQRGGLDVAVRRNSGMARCSAVGIDEDRPSNVHAER